MEAAFSLSRNDGTSIEKVPFQTIYGCEECLSLTEKHNINPALTVEELRPINYFTMAKTMRAWENDAWDKHKLAERKKDLAEKRLFQDCYKMCELIRKCFDWGEDCKLIYDRVFVCCDDRKDIQAIALTSLVTRQRAEKNDVYLKISLMVSRPQNLRASLNLTEGYRVQGAARALLKKLAQVTQEEQKHGIYLRSLELAQGFYTKFGFTPVEKGSTYIDKNEDGDYPMELSQEKVAALSMISL